MMRYRITLSYDGGGFCGWQSQPSGGSIQQAVEDAVFRLTGERTSVVGSGRTDAGVHAIAQVAHFDCQKTLSEKTVIGGLNAYLPQTVRVTGASVADAAFDARKSVKKKTYMYLMYTGAETPLVNGRALKVNADIDVAAMNAAAKQLIGKHDFATFKASGGGAKTSVRTVYDARVEERDGFIAFYIAADGFLYNMVRIISAQLIKIGCGGKVDIAEIMEKRDRAFAKELAPACALYLYGVEY